MAIKAHCVWERSVCRRALGNGGAFVGHLSAPILPILTSSSNNDRGSFVVRTFSLMGEKREGVVFSRPLRALRAA